MYSIRKWMFKPKKTDGSALAGFFYADEELNMIAAELDGFNGKNDPERCTTLVNQLRACQDKLLHYVDCIMLEMVPDQCASRDFRAKFPDDVLQESLAGQLWFSAECLAAGSNIMNREAESASMRPLAKAFTKHIDQLRSLLRDQCLKNGTDYSRQLLRALQVFDNLFAEFELSYVSAMVPVKSVKEFDALQDIVVLFSETVQRSLKLKLLTEEMIDICDPALMFTIPRLAIICGLLIYPEGPLNADMDPMNMSEMFRPFQMILYKIRELLWTLTQEELWELENLLCNSENSAEFKNNLISQSNPSKFKLTESSSPSQSISKNTFIRCLSENDSEQAEMTQSPSIITIVSNDRSKNQNSSESSNSEILSNEIRNCCTISNDSGILSDGVLCNSNSLEFNSDASTSRTLRHSLSWPTCDIDSNSKLNYVNYNDICGNTSYYTNSRVSSQNITCIHKNSTHEYHFNLPLNTSKEFNHLTKHIRSHSLDRNFKFSHSLNSERNQSTEQPWTNSLQCIFISNEASNAEIEERQQKISLVTNALNEVFLTDINHNVNSNGDIPSNILRTNVDVRSENGCNSIGRDRSNRNHTQSSKEENNDLRNVTNSLPENISNNNYENSLNSSNNFSPYIYDNSEKVSHNLRDNNSSGNSPQILPRHNFVNVDYDWDRQSYTSTETSSYNSECQDEEEIALAIQAAELAARNEARSRFQSSSDLIHRLFVCISGVADQLQTNYAGDLRHILKCVFEIHSSALPENDVLFDDLPSTLPICDDSEEEVITDGEEADEKIYSYDPPQWVPDEQVLNCNSCSVIFTFTRRRHHCRNCGKIYCGRCSSNMVPLPHFGHSKPVRVCNHCFIFEVNPFTS